MVLGPPKTPNFISASKPTRITGRESEALGFSDFVDTRGESPRFDRYRRDEKEKDAAPPRDFSDLRARRATPKEDVEGWTPVSRTPQKTMGSEEGDRFRREFREGEKKGGNTPWDRDRKYEGFGKDREQRPRPRRDESSWLLEDRGQDRNNRDTYRENNNNRYGGRAEKDPEWMDSSADGKESKQAHSMEDFQKWKERMKANNGAPPRTGNAENEKKDPEPIAQAVQEPEANQFGSREDDSSRDDSDDGVPLGKGLCPASCSLKPTNVFQHLMGYLIRIRRMVWTRSSGFGETITSRHRVIKTRACLPLLVNTRPQGSRASNLSSVPPKSLFNPSTNSNPLSPLRSGLQTSRSLRRLRNKPNLRLMTKTVKVSSVS